MSVSSNWKITYDLAGTPLVIADFDQDIGDEWEMPFSQMVQDRPRLRAGSMKYTGRGNVSRGLRITTHKEHASDVAARNWMLQFSAALPVLEVKILTIQIRAGDTYRMEDACIRSASTRLDSARGDKAVTLTTWDITGGKLTQV